MLSDTLLVQDVGQLDELSVVPGKPVVRPGVLRSVVLGLAEVVVAVVSPGQVHARVALVLPVVEFCGLHIPIKSDHKVVSIKSLKVETKLCL